MSAANERLDALLVQRATEGLDAREISELDRLIRQHPHIDPHAFDRAAAALHVACLRGAAVPARVRAKLDAAANDFAEDRRSSNLVPRPAARLSSRNGLWPSVAVAAALTLALAAWWPRLWPQPSPAVQRATLLDAGAERLPWTATADPAAAAASGDVVWDPAMQRGFMRFVGLSPNVPSQVQYQLWIFDSARDQRYPIDGGVFDIPSGLGEVIVPIRARLPVGHAVMFAITVEQPGGVVVSSRERVVLLAQAG